MAEEKGENLLKNEKETGSKGNENGIEVEMIETEIERGKETGIGIEIGKETESVIDTKIETDLQETEDTDSYYLWLLI